jgi:hypothetical protein
VTLQLATALGPDLTRMELVPAYVGLLRDNEAGAPPPLF